MQTVQLLEESYRRDAAAREPRVTTRAIRGAGAGEGHVLGASKPPNRRSAALRRVPSAAGIT